MPQAPQRTATASAGGQRSGSQDRRPQDFQRDVNEGTNNILQSIQANFMTMQGRSGKNNGYPFFDGTFKGYPKFHRRWHMFQSIYHNLTPQRELVHQFRDNCMDKKVADHGLVLEIVGLVLQPPLAVRAGFARRHFRVQEDKVDRL